MAKKVLTDEEQRLVDTLQGQMKDNSAAWFDADNDTRTKLHEQNKTLSQDIDKITGGTWKSNESNANIHWSQPYIISLCGKNIIQNKEEWINNPDSYISKSLLLALIDKATGGTKEKYLNVKYDYWSRANLNSLCDKGIIENPKVWAEDYEGWVTKGELMALLCKAYKI